MEPRRVSILATAMAAVLVAAAGALFIAYQQRDAEGERLAAAYQTATGERDALKAERDALTRERDALKIERDALASDAQAQRERAASREVELKAMEKSNAELSAAKAKLAQGLSETERKASAAAQARAELSRELLAKEQTLAQAKARSAELNKAYENLLKDKSQLAASDAAHRAELERTRKSFEEVQSLIARLTGARGIYTVQDTDSLSKIAAFFYHDGRRWPDIFKANAHLIDHPDLIYPEQVLIVPH
jgi:nucleoid-associated protein YgaU